jgi:hypothetical protein
MPAEPWIAANSTIDGQRAVVEVIFVITLPNAEVFTR